ncbi:hypothetical protein DFH11DRAFT_1748031 [Phellopilus nigrolimitatus]|nr:hypothetical protein DFH11DRAFT_1748031 [Phellopilus nigrolimitatus]
MFRMFGWRIDYLVTAVMVAHRPASELFALAMMFSSVVNVHPDKKIEDGSPAVARDSSKRHGGCFFKLTAYYLRTRRLWLEGTLLRSPLSTAEEGVTSSPSARESRIAVDLAQKKNGDVILWRMRSQADARLQELGLAARASKDGASPFCQSQAGAIARREPEKRRRGPRRCLVRIRRSRLKVIHRAGEVLFDSWADVRTYTTGASAASRRSRRKLGSKFGSASPLRAIQYVLPAARNMVELMSASGVTAYRAISLLSWNRTRKVKDEIEDGHNIYATGGDGIA